MAVFDHLGVTVGDLTRAVARFDPLLSELGFRRHDDEGSVLWHQEGEPEIILYRAREAESGPHVHGRVGWQHLAFEVGSREAVDRFHALAVANGWSPVREPKEYPRFSDRYYATFLEDDDGIRIEFMHNPPREAAS